MRRMLATALALVACCAVPRFVAAQGHPLAARELARGTVIAAEDVATDSVAAADVARITGFVTRRVVRKGEALREPAVSPAPLVANGSAVMVRATVEGVTVARSGTALSDASLGSTVRVRLSSQRTVNTIVTGPATVRIP
jgi:flagella basal body P-ring formation protein FlgA